MLPDQKGFTSLRRYLTGDTLAQRQAVRDGILATTADDFKAFGARLDVMRGSPETGAVVFGSKAAFEEANKAGARLDVKTVI